jgi:Tetratrico peptide repeat
MTTQPSDATPGLTPELEEAIRRGYAQRDRANMGPTIAYFESLLAEHPDHPVLVYEMAGAYDTAGQEEKARELYERAMGLGLAGDALRRCLCQYGSTLRWLGQYNESLAALDRAKREWPESDAVRVFRALTLNDADRSDEAVAELMTVITAHAEVTDLGRWAEGLRGLAQWLADGRPDSLLSPRHASGRMDGGPSRLTCPGRSPVGGRRLQGSGKSRPGRAGREDLGGGAEGLLSGPCFERLAAGALWFSAEPGVRRAGDKPAGDMMGKRTETIEHRTCDLCGQETDGEELVTLHRSGDRIKAARLAVSAAIGTQAGESNVDICPACRKRPISDVLEVMYPTNV